MVQAPTELTEGLFGVLAPLPGWAQALVLVLGGGLAGGLAHTVLWWLVRRLTVKGEESRPAYKLVKRAASPGCFIVALLGAAIGMGLAMRASVAPAWLVESWPEIFGSALTIGITWLVIALISGLDDLLLAKYRMDVRDNLRARRMHTQVRVLSRTLMVVAALVGAAVTLLQFDGVEEIGASLLASAGIAGIAVGFAAKPVLGNLIAGIQIAITQPIRLDDAVIIEGEWGWIEEITSTYVVVKIWDQRRLIVPFSRIIEEPFQNWTRNSSEILGSVTLYVDYSCPVQALRDELDRILEGHPKWDGRAKVLQTIDATEKTMVLRALVTAVDSPTAWELRCDVRERLLSFLQREHPYALPREREVEYREDQWPKRAAPPPAKDAKDMEEHELDDPTLRGEGAAPPPLPRTEDTPGPNEDSRGDASRSDLP